VNSKDVKPKIMATSLPPPDDIRFYIFPGACAMLGFLDIAREKDEEKGNGHG